MAQFLAAFDFMLPHEDTTPPQFEEVIDNNGGRAIAGINSKSFPAEEVAIAALPQDRRYGAVSKFYFTRFWAPMMLGGLEDQELANQVLDSGVNQGPGTAIMLLQRAANSLAHSGVTLLVVDGGNGPLTRETVNALDGESIMAAFRMERLARYAESPDAAIYLGTAEKPGPWRLRTMA